MDITNIQSIYLASSQSESQQIEAEKSQVSKAVILKNAAGVVAPLIDAPTTNAAISPDLQKELTFYEVISELFLQFQKGGNADPTIVSKLKKELFQMKGNVPAAIEKQVNEAINDVIDPDVFIGAYAVTMGKEWVLPFLQQNSNALAGSIPEGYNYQMSLITIQLALVSDPATSAEIDQNFWGMQEMGYNIPQYFMNYAFSMAGGDAAKAKKIYQSLVASMPAPIQSSPMYKVAYQNAQQLLENFPSSWTRNDYANIQVKLALHDFFSNINS